MHSSCTKYQRLEFTSNVPEWWVFFASTGEYKESLCWFELFHSAHPLFWSHLCGLLDLFKTNVEHTAYHSWADNDAHGQEHNVNIKQMDTILMWHSRYFFPSTFDSELSSPSRVSTVNSELRSAASVSGSFHLDYFLNAHFIHTHCLLALTSAHFKLFWALR